MGKRFSYWAIFHKRAKQHAHRPATRQTRQASFDKQHTINSQMYIRMNRAI